MALSALPFLLARLVLMTGIVKRLEKA